MRRFVLLIALIIFVTHFVCAGTGAESIQTIQLNAKQIQAQNQLAQLMTGYITWMSNRDGDWEIYSMDIGGTSIKKLTNNNVPDTSAHISPNGKLIAWTRGKFPKQDVWLMNADGSGKRRLIKGANMGTWASSKKLVFFRDRNDTATYTYDLGTGKEKKIWPPRNAKLKARDIRGVKPSPDGKLLVGWSSNPRGTWIFSADGRFQKHVHGGCEGHFAPDGSFVYWVMNPGTFGHATLQGKILDPLYKINQTDYGHTYFPKLSRDMGYLIFGACPNNQHSHDTSDYEIFIMKMENLKPIWHLPIRLTYDPGTDRWPDIYIRIDKTAPDPPRYMEAEPHGQQIRSAECSA